MSRVFPSRMKKCLFLFGVFFSLAAAGLAFGSSREPVNEAQVRAVADQLRCPVCRGIPIAESPSELAQNMMQQIRDHLARGKSAEEILAYFEDRYGEWILLKPKPEGMNLVIWIVPLLLFLAGLVVLVLALMRWTKPALGSRSP